MKITGELLKSQRLNLKLSLQDVSTALKLSSKTIAAIEEGDLEKLPSKTFIRGFVKSYAQYLKLDVDAVLRQFQEEMGSTTPLPKVPPPKPATEENQIKAPRPSPKQTAQNYSVEGSSTLSEALKEGDGKKKIALMISIAVGLVAFLIISNKIIDAFNSNPVVAPTGNESALSPAPPESSEVVNNAVSTDSTAAAATSKNESSTIDSRPAELPKAKVSEANQISVDTGFEKASGKPVEIMLETKKELEIFYARGDSNQLTSLKMSANQVQILRSPVGLYLKISDGSAVKLSVNGTLKGPAGPANKEVRLSF